PHPDLTLKLLFITYNHALNGLTDNLSIEKPTADGYDCSDLDLSFVPNQITESTKSLDFSFNYLLALYNSTFQRLKNLVSLDLTRLEDFW
uniref:Uncharacterized protein n=1 Tax=Electrophorus electricus TaxID=8005 RepID=A0A4W4F882_ELEEL